LNWNAAVLSREAERSSGVESKKRGLGPRFFNEALSLECSFYGMEGNVLEWL
jgi:hypothetical protein